MNHGANPQQKAADAAGDVRKKGEEALDHAKTAANDVLETGKARAEEELNYGKGVVAERMQHLAHAARTAADDLREHDQPMLASWAESAADNVSKAAGSLDGRDLGEIFGQVEDYARRQPAVFLAGVALAGFAAARFAKAARDSAAERNGYGHGHVPASRVAPGAPGQSISNRNHGDYGTERVQPGFTNPSEPANGQTIANRNHPEVNNV